MANKWSPGCNCCGGGNGGSCPCGASWPITTITLAGPWASSCSNCDTVLGNYVFRSVGQAIPEPHCSWVVPLPGFTCPIDPSDPNYDPTASDQYYQAQSASGEWGCYHDYELSIGLGQSGSTFTLTVRLDVAMAIWRGYSGFAAGLNAITAYSYCWSRSASTCAGLAGALSAATNPPNVFCQAASNPICTSPTIVPEVCHWAGLNVSAS